MLTTPEAQLLFLVLMPSCLFAMPTWIADNELPAEIEPTKTILQNAGFRRSASPEFEVIAASKLSAASPMNLVIGKYTGVQQYFLLANTTHGISSFQEYTFPDKSSTDEDIGSSSNSHTTTNLEKMTAIAVQYYNEAKEFKFSWKSGSLLADPNSNDTLAHLRPRLVRSSETDLNAVAKSQKHTRKLPMQVVRFVPPDMRTSNPSPLSKSGPLPTTPSASLDESQSPELQKNGPSAGTENSGTRRLAMSAFVGVGKSSHERARLVMKTLLEVTSDGRTRLDRFYVQTWKKFVGVYVTDKECFYVAFSKLKFGKGNGNIVAIRGNDVNSLLEADKECFEYLREPFAFNWVTTEGLDVVTKVDAMQIGIKAKSAAPWISTCRNFKLRIRLESIYDEEMYIIATYENSDKSFFAAGKRKFYYLKHVSAEGTITESIAAYYQYFSQEHKFKEEEVCNGIGWYEPLQYYKKVLKNETQTKIYELLKAKKEVPPIEKGWVEAFGLMPTPVEKLGDNITYYCMVGPIVDVELTVTGHYVAILQKISGVYSIFKLYSRNVATLAEMYTDLYHHMLSQYQGISMLSWKYSFETNSENDIFNANVRLLDLTKKLGEDQKKQIGVNAEVSAVWSPEGDERILAICKTIVNEKQGYLFVCIKQYGREDQLMKTGKFYLEDPLQPNSVIFDIVKKEAEAYNAYVWRV